MRRPRLTRKVLRGLDHACENMRAALAGPDVDVTERAEVERAMEWLADMRRWREEQQIPVANRCLHSGEHDGKPAALVALDRARAGAPDPDPYLAGILERGRAECDGSDD